MNLLARLPAEQHYIYTADSGRSDPAERIKRIHEWTFWRGEGRASDVDTL